MSGNVISDMTDEANINEAQEALEKEPLFGKDNPVSNLEKITSDGQSIEYSKQGIRLKDAQSSSSRDETNKVCLYHTGSEEEPDGQSEQNVSKHGKKCNYNEIEPTLDMENQPERVQAASNTDPNTESFNDMAQSKSDSEELGGADGTSPRLEKKADDHQFNSNSDNTSSGETDAFCGNTELSKSRTSLMQDEAAASRPVALDPNWSVSPTVNETEQSTPLNQTDINIAFSWCELCYDETFEKVKVAGFCSDCNCFICRPCLTAHKKSPASRIHRILQGTRMPKTINDKPIKFPSCHLHSGNLKSKFCLHHGKTACSNCLQEQHHGCKSTSIHNVCKDLDKENIQQLINTVKCILDTASAAETATESNIIDAESQRRDLIKDVQNLQVYLISKTEEICTEMIKEITDLSSRNRERMSEHLQVLSDLTNSFSEDVLNLERVKNKHIDTNLFIRIQEIVESALQTRSEFENIRKELSKMQLSISVDSAISSFLSASNKLGDVKGEVSQIQEIMAPLTEISFPKMLEIEGSRTVQLENDSVGLRPSATDTINETAKPGSSESSSNAVTSSIEKNIVDPFTKYRVTANHLDPSTTEDENPCKIWGMDVTSNGTLILADNANKAVKIFSPENRHLSSVLLIKKPYCLAVIDDMTAAVCSPYDIFVLDISDPCSASVRKSVRLDFWAISMALCNDSLVVIKAAELKVKNITESGEKEWEWVNIHVFSVRMIDLEGHELWATPEYNEGEKIFERAHSLAVTVIDCKTAVLVTDWMKQKITVLDASNGYLLKTIDVKGKEPHGLTVDSDLNVYVCYANSKEICMWSENLEQSRSILSGTDLPSHPLYITYNDNLNELYFCCLKKNTIYRIILSTEDCT